MSAVETRTQRRRRIGRCRAVAADAQERQDELDLHVTGRGSEWLAVGWQPVRLESAHRVGVGGEHHGATQRHDPEAVRREDDADERGLPR